jgi:MinD-like ATPase involved in chromosome partitioning or flagellar assembly
MLLALWSPKGGSGTSVLAAACALVLARDADGARVADLAGDQPAIFALASEPDTGLADWLAAGPEAPVDALERLAVTAAPGVALLPRGSAARPLAPQPAAEAGAALAVALRDGSVPTIVDAGTAAGPAARAVVEVADMSVVVLRPCYLALRRAVRSPLLERAAGAVLIEEAGRALGPTEVRDVLDRTVLARIPSRGAIARAVDAGVLSARLPEPLARPTARLLTRLGLPATRHGEAA